MFTTTQGGHHQTESEYATSEGCGMGIDAGNDRTQASTQLTQKERKSRAAGMPIQWDPEMAVVSQFNGPESAKAWLSSVVLSWCNGSVHTWVSNVANGALILGVS